MQYIYNCILLYSWLGENFQFWEGTKELNFTGRTYYFTHLVIRRIFQTAFQTFSFTLTSFCCYVPWDRYLDIMIWFLSNTSVSRCQLSQHTRQEEYFSKPLLLQRDRDNSTIYKRNHKRTQIYPTKPKLKVPPTQLPLSPISKGLIAIPTFQHHQTQREKLNFLTRKLSNIYTSRQYSAVNSL